MSQSFYDWCLENGEWGKQLLYEFGDGNNTQEFTNEYGMPVIASEFSYGSNKKIKWTCKEYSHTWQTTIYNRVKNKTKCPYCSGKKASEQDNLLTWCKQNGAWGQQLIDEWVGLDENDTPIEMSEYTKSSHKKVLWKCSKNHTWYANANSRASHKLGCPICSNKIIVNGINDLKTWCLSNEGYKHLIDEWVGLDENNNKIEMTQVSRATPKKVKWKCSEGHEWVTSVNHRTSIQNKRDCPICANKKVIKGENDLKTFCLSNAKYKHLIDEWVGIDENDNKIDITEVTKGSGKKVQWKCSACGHYWTAMITHRIACESGCPACAGQVVVPGSNDLKSWCEKNGQWGEKLKQEWLGIDENGNKIDMAEVTRATTKKVLWHCSKGHKWLSDIYHRTSRMGDCPYCNTKSTSYPEQFLFRALQQLYPNTINRGKYNGYEYDIMIPEVQTYIEYSGINWHIDKLDRDEKKASICKENSIRFIQIYAHSGQIEIDEDIFDENQIIYRVASSLNSHNQQLVEILQHILNSLMHNISEINIEQAQTEAFNFMHDIEETDDELEDF